MNDDNYKFLIAGVGGQGTVLASDILAEVGIRLGYDTKKSDILGLAVRGGSVVSHIQWAPKVHAPVVDEGEVDFLIGFEWLETLRKKSYIKPDGFILANDCRIDPMTVSSGQAVYPDEQSAIICCTGAGTLGDRGTAEPIAVRADDGCSIRRAAAGVSVHGGAQPARRVHLGGHLVRDRGLQLEGPLHQPGRVHHHRW